MENVINTVNTANSQNNDENREITISLVGNIDERGKRVHDLREKDVDLNHIDMKNHDKLCIVVRNKGPVKEAFNNIFDNFYQKWDTPTARKYKKMGFTYYDYIKNDKRNGMKGTTNSRSVAPSLIITINKMENRPKNVNNYISLLKAIVYYYENKYSNNIEVIHAVIHADEIVKVQQPKVKALSDAQSVLTDSLIQEDEGKRMYGAVHMHMQIVFKAHAITDPKLRKKIRELKATMKKEAMDKDGDKFDKKIFEDRFTQYLVKNYGCSLITGPEVQMSITKALYEMGFNLDNNLEKLPIFDQHMNYLRQEFIPDFAETKGFKVDRRLNPNRHHFFKEEYVRSKVNEQTLNNLMQNQKLFIIVKEEIEKKYKDYLICSDELKNKQKEIDAKLPILEEKEKKVAFYDKVIDFTNQARSQLSKKSKSKFDDIKNYPKDQLGKYVGNFCRFFALKDIIYTRLQKDLERFNGYDFIDMGKNMIDNKCNNIFDYLERSMNKRIYLVRSVPDELLKRIEKFSNFYKSIKNILNVTSLDPTVDKSKEQSYYYSRGGGGMGM